MRGACLFVALVCAVGCGGGKPTNEAKTETDPKGAGKVEPTGPVRDVAEYVAELRKTVPVRVDEFKAAKLKCDPYVTSNLAGVEIFDSLTLTIDPPVYLKDGLTGKTQRYVGARMVRSDTGDVFATGSEPRAAEMRKNGSIPITWGSVTMVAEAKSR